MQSHQRFARRLAIITMAFACGPLGAQRAIEGFPKAAVAFLDRELPQVDAAVAIKDRAYFKGGAERAKRFLEDWGLRRDPVLLERYPACIDAITDFPIVGLCRLSEPGTVCDPSTVLPKFASDVAGCRAAAR